VTLGHVVARIQSPGRVAGAYPLVSNGSARRSRMRNGRFSSQATRCG
jgi:hypothetical protein